MSETTTVPVVIPTLTDQEQTFCLGVIEYGGNLGAAYAAAFNEDPKGKNFSLRARNLICRPEIAMRIQELSRAIDENTMISLASHLGMLAQIRDTAIAAGDLKVALNAEKNRGEAAGYYVQRSKNENTNTQRVIIEMHSTTPGSIEEWAAKHGRPPQIIDV